MPFYVTHGGGLPCSDHDYKALAPFADYLLHMIYTPSVMHLFQSSEKMAEYVGAEKLIPLVEPCCESAFSCRDVDTMTAALVAPAFLGCAGVGIWSKKTGEGILFEVPEDFMLNYRFGGNSNTADLMMQPKKLQHAQKNTYRVKMIP